MPPRRRPVPNQPPARRPKVAGLRRPAGESATEAEQDSNAADQTQVIPRVPAEPTAEPAAAEPVAEDKPRPTAKRRPRPTRRPEPVEEPAEPWPAEPVDVPAARSRLAAPLVLAVVTVLVGGLAVWFGLEWGHTRSGVDVSNTALTDNATTSEVSGQVTSAVSTVFSYDYTNLGKTQQAVQKVLTGTALCQYNQLFADVKQQAPSQKLVLTTTVQKQGVEMLQGGTARVLLLVEQHDTRATTNQTSDSQSIIAVNAVKQASTWKISAIDTFNGTNPGTCKS
jgi:Mce-associated membrane protein